MKGPIQLRAYRDPEPRDGGTPAAGRLHEPGPRHHAGQALVVPPAAAAAAS